MDLTDFRTLGRSGLRVSPLMLGAMNFGDARFGMDETASAAVLDRYLDAGGNMIDTANSYAEGLSERILGGYLASHAGLRDRLVIATKFTGNLYRGDPNGGGAGRKAILQQVEGSLRRLGTDYIDLYWQHHFDRHTPIEETMATLDDLVRAGKVRYIGLSDTPAWAVARAATLAEWRGWPAIAAIQIEYSLRQRTVEGEQLGVAAALGLGVTPWSPLGGGLLTGKYTRETSDPTDSARASFMGSMIDSGLFDLVDRMTQIARTHETTVATVALAWVRQRPLVTSTIVGARTVEQLDSNLASLQVTLTPEEVGVLDELTTPRLEFPADMLKHRTPGFHQNGTTINGVEGPAEMTGAHA